MLVFNIITAHDDCSAGTRAEDRSCHTVFSGCYRRLINKTRFLSLYNSISLQMRTLCAIAVVLMGLRRSSIISVRASCFWGFVPNFDPSLDLG